MIFQKATTLFSLGALLILSGTYFQWGHVRSTDLAQVTALTGESKNSAPKKPEAAHQTRSGVCKDLWYTQDKNQRLHYKIKSDRSILTFLINQGKVDLVENLEGIDCWMQDKITSAGTSKAAQQVRHVQANEGIYRFNTSQFQADTVHLALFQLPGENLPGDVRPDAAYVQGVASEVSFSVSGSRPQFQAQNFKATLRKQKENN